MEIRAGYSWLMHVMRFSTFSFCLILGLALFAGCGKKAEPPKPAEIAPVKINSLESSARVTLPDGTEKDVQAGDDLPAGSRIKASGGWVDLGVDARQAVRLQKGARVEVKPSDDDALKLADLEIYLAAGTVLASIKTDQPLTRRFQVRGPTGVCGARGTEFYVSNDGIQLEVGVGKGEVVLKGAAGGEVSIPGGHKAVARLTAPVTNIDQLVASEKALLSGVTYLNFDVKIGAAKKIISAAEVSTIRRALDYHRTMNGRYPARVEEALDGGNRDPWGRPYNYIVTGGGSDFQLSSSGPDGIEGTSDDIRVR